MTNMLMETYSLPTKSQDIDRSFYVVIPVRYASTRLPGKALLDLGGKPILQHVYEKTQQSAAKQVIIATDDERIAKAARDFGAVVCMTAQEHKCGTDRIAEVAAQLQWAEDEIIVNVQGDEPFIHPLVVNQVAQNLMLYSSSTGLHGISEGATIATLCEPLQESADLFNPSIVKVVYDKDGYALYFSRAPIPWDRENFIKNTDADNLNIKSALVAVNTYFRHLGIYAYRSGFLQQYVKLPSCSLETIESLEQLRALWYGYKIHVAQSCVVGMLGIDTKEDLVKARQKH